MRLTVDRIDRTTVEVPYRDVHARNMHRQHPSWKYYEIFEVELADGSTGYGENMLFYGWGDTGDEDVDRVNGANAPELLWDDSLGPGLQMALFDAVSRALGVPVHELLGERVRDRVPLAWWCNDMPTEDWVAECRTAIEAGYTSIKLKGRPWFDLREQIEAISDATPDWFGVDIDFNATLLDADRGLPVLEDIDGYPQIRTFEGPIPNEDTEGYRRIRAAVDADVARHYGNPPGNIETICGELCDGFVVSNGARSTRDAGSVAAAADLPLFVQQVGTDITGAYSLHLASVLETATWPSINCFQVFDRSLLSEPIDVEDGMADVPDTPGLGYEIDTAVIEELAVDKPSEKLSPPRLIEAVWPDGTIMYFAEGQQMPDHAREGDLPFYQRGVTAHLVDDGSEEWEELRQRALDGPVTMTAGEAPDWE